MDKWIQKIALAWSIIALAGAITLLHDQLVFNKHRDCLYDYMEEHNGWSSYDDGARLCKNIIEKQWLMKHLVK